MLMQRPVYLRRLCQSITFNKLWSQQPWPLHAVPLRLKWSIILQPIHSNISELLVLVLGYRLEPILLLYYSVFPFHCECCIHAFLLTVLGISRADIPFSCSALPNDFKPGHSNY